MMVKWDDVKEDYAKKDAEIAELKTEVESRDKYIFEFENDKNCVARCVHKRAVERREEKIRELETMVATCNKQLEKVFGV